MTQFLFITDLDNTLVGDDDALRVLNDRLDQHRQAYGTRIVYATGRSLTRYRELQSEKPLLPPDALVTSVGTEIYYGDGAEPDNTWSKVLNRGWDRDRILAITAHFADLTPQANTEQGAFKVSFFLSQETADDVVPHLEAILRDEELAINLIYSGGKDLDILPQGANKGTAMAFLQEQWQFEAMQTVACGDSGNDLALFAGGQSRGVIVGNAQPELLEWHYANPSPARYLAEASCAGGILEGLNHFGFLTTG